MDDFEDGLTKRALHTSPQKEGVRAQSHHTSSMKESLSHAFANSNTFGRSNRTAIKSDEIPLDWPTLYRIYKLFKGMQNEFLVLMIVLMMVEFRHASQ